MASVQETKAASYSGPVSVADATGLRGVFRETVSGTNVSRALPSGIPGNFVDIQALTADAQVSFSVAAQTLVINQASAINATPSAAAGFTIPAGTCRSVFVPKDCLYINFIGTSGTLELYCSEYTQKLLSSG